MVIKPIGWEFGRWVSTTTANAIPVGSEAGTQLQGLLPKEEGSDFGPNLREVFRDFVGQTLFAEMLRAMRKTLGKPAYFHGGRAEEIFQAELDRHLVEKAAQKSGEHFADQMFELFTLRMR